MENSAANGNVMENSVDHLHRGSNQSGMRAHNERLVLSLVRRHGALSKTDIARMTGLSAQTVSVIMRELEADGLLLRGEPQRGKVGQPSIPLSLAPDGALFFGLKVGRRSADLVLTDFVGTVRGDVHYAYTYPNPEDTVRFARDAMARLSTGLSAKRKDLIAGLGIAIPFRLWNWADSIDAPQAAMDAWRNYDIRAEIAEDCDFPVYLQNDASAACCAELVFGQSSDPRDFLYFYIGFFVGGGVVLNGGLFAGRTGNAGALGPMPVPDGRGGICQLIDVASIATLERALLATGQSSDALWESPDAWNVDNEILGRWIEGVGRGIAHATLSAASVIDFEAVLVDGWLPLRVRKAIVEATRDSLATLDHTGIDAPDVREGTVGRNARALGGASLPLSQRFLVDQNAFLKDR